MRSGSGRHGRRGVRVLVSAVLLGSSLLPSTVHSAAAPPTAEQTAAPPEAASVPETGTGSVFRWASVTDSKAFGGSYLVERHRGAHVAFRFSGTSVAWYATRGPGHGRAYVFLDGVA